MKITSLFLSMHIYAEVYTYFSGVYLGRIWPLKFERGKAVKESVLSSLSKKINCEC